MVVYDNVEDGISVCKEHQESFHKFALESRNIWLIMKTIENEHMSEIDTRKIMHVKKSNFSFNRNLSSFYRTNKKNDDEISNVDTKQRNGYICFFFYSIRANLSYRASICKILSQPNLRTFKIRNESLGIRIGAKRKVNLVCEISSYRNRLLTIIPDRFTNI